MIGFFAALWMLIMWDFVCINAGLRPLLAERSSPAFRAERITALA